MKILKYISFLLITLAFTSCLEEEDVFTQPNDRFLITETSFMTSFLNAEFVTDKALSKKCFEIVFPIVVYTNTGNQLTVNHYNGLQEIVNNQHTEFYVNGIVLPIEIKNTKFPNKLIRNNEDFASLFSFCKMPTLSYTLKEKVGECFDFNYPITIYDQNNNLQQFISSKELLRFLEVQSDQFEVKLNFPVSIKSNLEKSNTEIESYYKLYKHLNKCSNCKTPTVKKQVLEKPNKLEFSIDTSKKIFSSLWYVNDKLITTSDPTKLIYSFPEKGNYKICSKLFIDNCNNEQIETCTEVAIEFVKPDCNLLSFKTTKNPEINRKYTFTVLKELTDFYQYYDWKINGEIVSNTTTGKLEYKFSDKGTYEICVLLETPECPNGKSFCNTITID